MDRLDNEFFTSINTVSKELGVPAHTLRYWEKQFPAVVRPVTGAGGRRYYRPEMVARLGAIRDLLYHRGMTIAGVKRLIHNGEFESAVVCAPAAMPRPAPVPRTAEPRPMAEHASGTVIDRAAIDFAIELVTQARDLLN